MNSTWKRGVRWGSETAAVVYKRKKNVFKFTDLQRVVKSWSNGLEKNKMIGQIDYIKENFGKKYIKSDVFDVFTFQDDVEGIIELLNKTLDVFLKSDSIMEKAKIKF